jgi:endonuclease G, mitochondrial
VDVPIPEKDFPPPTVKTVNNEVPVDKQADLYEYVAAITALPEFKSVNFTIGQKGEIVSHSAIILAYNEEHEQAHWVSYKLTSQMLKGAAKRTDKFKEDPKVSTKSASPTDYRLSGYDRGHLAPAGDFTYDATAMAESFYMSNMSPQIPSFNRGIWKKLEDQVRFWAKENEKSILSPGL